MAMGSAVTIARHSSSISPGRSARSTSRDPQIRMSLTPAVASSPSCGSTGQGYPGPALSRDRQQNRRSTSSAAGRAIYLGSPVAEKSWRVLAANRRGVRYFALDGTDHASRNEQASMIRRYIIWRNNHACDERLRRVTRPGKRSQARNTSSPGWAGGRGPTACCAESAVTGRRPAGNRWPLSRSGLLGVAHLLLGAQQAGSPGTCSRYREFGVLKTGQREGRYVQDHVRGLGRVYRDNVQNRCRKLGEARGHEVGDRLVHGEVDRRRCRPGARARPKGQEAVGGRPRHREIREYRLGEVDQAVQVDGNRLAS